MVKIQPNIIKKNNERVWVIKNIYRKKINTDMSIEDIIFACLVMWVFELPLWVRVCVCQVWNTRTKGVIRFTLKGHVSFTPYLPRRRHPYVYSAHIIPSIECYTMNGPYDFYIKIGQASSSVVTREDSININTGEWRIDQGQTINKYNPKQFPF